MSNSLYYGEISAKLAAHLFKNPEQVRQLDKLMNKTDEDQSDSIWTVCADAARVFDVIEDLSGEQCIDWHKALDHYAEQVMKHLLTGQVPFIIDLIFMASRSLEHIRK